MKLGLFDEALVCYDNALELDPEFLLAWTNKGNILDDLEIFDESLDCFENALQIDS